MKAAVLQQLGSPLVIEELPDPGPRAGEVVVDVVAAPVLAYTNEVLSGARDYPLLLPLAIGCGAVGQVCSVGPDATRLQAGDWVFCDPTVRSRDDPTTPDILLQGWIAPGEGAQRLQSHFRHGPFAEQVLVPLENAVRLGSIDAEAAPRWTALNTLLVPYGGLLAANLKAGETVVVSGATGHFGSAGVAVALAMGARRVVAPGRNEEILDDLVRRFGPRVATVQLTGEEATDQERIRTAAGGPVDIVLDLLPPLPDARAARTAAMTVRPEGTVVLMGGLRVDLPLPYGHLMRNNITVRGQYMYPRDAPLRLIGLIEAGQLSLDEFEVVGFELSRANEAVAYAAETGGPFRLTVLEP